MRTKNIKPTKFSTMHSNTHQIVGVAFASSDREYVFQLPAVEAKKLVVGLVESIRLAELPVPLEDKPDLRREVAELENE